MRKRTLSL